MMTGVYVRAWLAGAKEAIRDIESGIPYILQRSAMGAIGYQFSLFSRDNRVIEAYGTGYLSIYKRVETMPLLFPESEAPDPNQSE